MFKRRKKQSSLQQLKSLVLARKGIFRPFTYMYHRIKRLPERPHRVAIGVACGVGVSFTPFFGFHLIIGYVLTLLLGGHVAGMIVGSLIGNPWTLPIFWTAGYFLGRMLIDITVPDMSPETLTGLSFSEIMDKPVDLLLPMSVGGLILGLIAGVIAYYTSRSVVDTYQKHRAQRLKKRRETIKQRMQKIISDIEKKESGQS